MNITKNIKNYYAYSTFTNLIIIGPIFVIFLLAKGLSFTEIMLLQAIGGIGVVVFEVPTGVIADKYGRKLSICMGSALLGVSLLMYALGNSFWIFVLAEVVVSLAGSLKSGADTALIYDVLKAKKRENEFQRIEGKARSFSLYAQAIGSIAASLLYDININLPMLVSILFMVITVFITIRFEEPAIGEKDGKYGLSYFNQIKDSGKYIYKHEKIKAIILFSMIFFIFYRAGFWFFQPYMKAVDIPVKLFGLIFFLFNIVAAQVSKHSHTIMEKTKPRTMTFMAMLIIVSFVLLGVTKVWVGVFAILLQQAARGLYNPVIRKYLNKHIPSDKRATILSFQSLMLNIAVAITSPIIGILMDSTNVYTSHIVMAGVMIVLVLLASRYMNNRLGKGHRKKEVG